MTSVTRQKFSGRSKFLDSTCLTSSNCPTLGVGGADHGQSLPVARFGASGSSRVKGCHYQPLRQDRDDHIEAMTTVKPAKLLVVLLHIVTDSQFELFRLRRVHARGDSMRTPQSRLSRNVREPFISHAGHAFEHWRSEIAPC
jgi:hypothetical protein